VKPLIGIMLDCEDKGSFSAYPYHALQKSYFSAVLKAGGLPFGIPCDSGGEHLARVDGVLVPGGDYLSPPEWYADGVVSDFPPNPARAEGELALLKNVLNSKKPLLATCAGMQVMNVALGGKLTGKLPNHRPEGSDRYALRHTLKIVPGTKLHAIAGDSMRANTHHKEGIALLAPGLTASAFAEDGVIEAIEYAPHPFALGVQWHPEHSTDDLQNMKIFEAFVGACQGTTST
jgi:putative glutamine amidotransferase